MINPLLFSLVLVLIVIVIIKINIDSNNKESESFDNMPISKKVIYNIIPTFDNQYLASFMPNSSDNNNLIITRSLKSNTWKGPLKNSSPDDKTIIVDLTYDKDKRLLGIGMTKKGNLSVYSLYKKVSEDVRSEWEEIKSNENIRSITYDYDGILMGCHAYNGQIYKKENENINSDWIGPINDDLPMKKVQFDKDGKLLGIGLLDFQIYKKKGNDWKDSEWDKEHIGTQKVFDMFHDYDGCLISSSYKGITKQTHPNYMSDFIDINSTKINRKTLSLFHLLKFRTGLDLIKHDDIGENEVTTDDITDPNLSAELNALLKFKKGAKLMCKNKVKNTSQVKNMELLDTNNQNKDIDEIENLINLLK